MAATVVALLPVLIPMIPGSIQQLNNLIAMFRAMGMSDEEILVHINSSETKIDPLILRVEGFQVIRHPDDKG